MANIYLGPIITDARDSIYLASHPETFFKAMDALKPYILTVVSSDCARFRLIRDEDIDLVDLRKKLEHLNDLGYKTNITFSARFFMGMSMIEMSDLVISWYEQEENQNVR